MRIDVKPFGFKKFERRLKSLERGARRLHGTHEIPLAELFPPGFLTRYTQFTSLDQMFQASGYEVRSRDDFERIPDNRWDEFIVANTRFSSWEKMLGKAMEQWMARQAAV